MAYEVSFTVNAGRMQKTVVSASSPEEAKRIVKAKNSGSLTIYSVKKV